MPIVAMPDNTQVSFPDDMPADQIRSLITQKFPDAAKGLSAPPQGVGGSIMDAVKGIPRSLLSGVMDAATAGGQAEAHAMSQPDLAAQIPNTDEAVKAIAGDLYSPQTTFGKIVGAGARTLTNPASYVGPGSLPLKIGANALSGMGSEAAGQAAEGTPLEGAARLGGSLAGAVAGAKALGPAAEKAAIPTIPELKRAEDFAYSAARKSGVEVDPKQLATWAAQKEQQLTAGDKYAFTGGPDGTAPSTLKLLDKIQNPPEGATVTAANLDTLRRQINDITGQTKDFKPTADAKAAMVLKREFANYLENPPAGHIVAGNAEDFVQAIKEGNATHSALQNTKTINQKITNAQDNTEGSIAASLSNQIKSQLRPILRNPKAQRGFTQDEVAAIRGVNRGTVASNVASQLGRGGAGVVPLGLHLAAGIPAAIASGGATVLPQIALATGLYGARKLGEQLTLGQAKTLLDKMAMRSPLYQKRASAIPPVDRSPYAAAIARALLQVR